MSETLVLTDPRFEPRGRRSWLDRVGLGLIRDERDLPFFYLHLQMTLFLVPAAVFMFTPGAITWYTVLGYYALLYGAFVDRFILMLHNVSHRPFFKKPFRLGIYWVTWVLGPLCGESPEAYYVHHLGMHHPENNLPDDLSSTMRFKRDRIDHFMRYFLRFFLLGWYEVARYHFVRERFRLFKRLVIGEGSYWVAVGVGLYFAFWPVMIVFVIPITVARFLMMAGNWAQHAFIDPEQPENPYRNSIVCINSRYNRRCYNDGYHVGHHVKASRHWTDMPADFEDCRDEYISNRSVVFHSIDYFMVWFYLMLGRYDWLANKAVHLGETPERDEYIAFLKSRVQAIPAAA